MKVKISHSQIADDTQELDLSVETPRGKDCVIGRSPDADFVLDDPDVSRFHCKFFYQSGNYYFCDLGSRNGSTFNNKVLQKDQSQLLNNGDIIRIGDYVLVMEDTASMEQPAETVVRIINPALFSQKPSTQNVEVENQEIIVNEAPENIETPVVEEVNTTNETENLIPENITSESVEVDEIQETETPLQLENENVEAENLEAENIVNESENVETNISETEDFQAFAAPEYTTVQPRDIPLPVAESASETSEDSSHDVSKSELTEETNVQERNQEEIEKIINEAEELPNSELEAVESEVSVQNENPVENIEQQEEIQETEESVAIDSETTEEIQESQTIDEAEQMEYNSEAEILEDISQVDIDATPEAESTETEETSETSSENTLPTVVTEKYTVLIAHDSKEAELVDFVNKHQELLSSCLTMSWNSVSENLKQQTGVNISEEIPAATSGGYQRIVSLINSNEILAVIFIRDLLQPQPGQANEETFLRLCNINNVLLATNLATAEAVVCHMKHGL